MRCKPRTLNTILFFVSLCLVLFPKIAFSLGFGQIKLNSYLNEPLSAEIEIIDPEDIDLNYLVASLAPVDDFKRADIVRPYYLTKMRFEIKSENRKTLIKITTADVVNQPFLEFLVVMSWPEGRLVRGYTLLLDPAPGNHTTQKEDPIQDHEAAKKIKEKVSKNEIRSKSTQFARNTIGSSSFDDTNTSFRTGTHSVQAPLEKLFEQENTEGQASKESPIPISPAVSITPVASTVPDLFPHASSIAAVPEVRANKIYDNKLLLASGLALLFAVAVTVWFFRHARDSLHTALPLEEIEIHDEEMSMKLNLASQYLLIKDPESAKEILDDILARGNTNEKEKAQALLDKIHTS